MDTTLKIDVELDEAKLESALRRIRRAAENTPAPSIAHKLITGDKFIKAMIDTGLLPENTTYVRIVAEIAKPIEMSFETWADSRLVQVGEALVEAHSPSDAIAK